MLIVNDRELVIRELAKAFPLVSVRFSVKISVRSDPQKLPAFNILENTLSDGRTSCQIGM